MKSGKDDGGGKPRLGGGCICSGRIIISKDGKGVTFSFAFIDALRTDAHTTWKS